MNSKFSRFGNFEYLDFDNLHSFNRLVDEINEIMGITCNHCHVLKSKFPGLFDKLKSTMPNYKKTQQVYLLSKNFKKEPLCKYCKTDVCVVIRDYNTHQKDIRIRPYCRKQCCLNIFNKETGYDKKRKDFLEKYGVSHQMYLKKVKEKIKQTCLKRYGTEHNKQQHFSIKTKKILNNGDILKEELKKNTPRELAKELNISHSTVYIYMHKHNLDFFCTSLEKIIKNILEQNNIKFLFNNRKIISYKKRILELDFFLPDFNLAIEVCGFYWHSEEILKTTRKTNPRQYHKIKYDLCKEKEITLITLFENEICEYPESIKKLLKLLLFDETPNNLNKNIEIENQIFYYLNKQDVVIINNRFGLGSLLKNYTINKKILPKKISNKNFNIWDCGHYEYKRILK